MRHLLFLFIFLVVQEYNCGYVKDQIVFKLESVETNCIRMLNGTASVGCQSSRQGNVGVLIKIHTSKDIQDAVEKLPLGIMGIIALVYVNDLDRELLNVLHENQNVQGILLLDGTSSLVKFSEDAACPNQLFSFYSTDAKQACHPWNAEGAIHPEGLRFLAIDKPIRFVNNKSEIDLLLNKCVIPFNVNLQANNFRCVGRMTFFMLAAGNADICIKRQQSGDGFSGRTPILCDPLSDRNVFAMLPPLSQRNTSTKADQFVLVARIDTFSSIYNSRAGDISTLSSIISVLSVAQAIGKSLDKFIARAKTSHRQLLFALFHGESLGYIGSSRWLWDVENARFPHPASKLLVDNVRQIGINAISFWLEIQQVANRPELFLHTDKNIYNSNKTLIDKIINNSGRNVHFVDPNQLLYNSLPPSSYHSVLKTSTHIPGMVLSSFGKGYYNYSYLNSIFDLQIRNNPNYYDEFITGMLNAAESALHAALTYVFDTTDPEIIDLFTIDKLYLKNLADCFFKKDYTTWQCPLFKSVLNATNDVNRRLWMQKNANDLFIGTAYTDSPIRKIVFALLVQALGEKEPAVNVASEQQCKDQNKKQNVYLFVWQNDPATNKGICYRTSIYLGMAKSPAFEIEDYDMSSGKYSTWMESQWSKQSIFEIYLKPDYHLELYALLMAILVLLISAPLNYGFKEQWFVDNSLPPASPHQL